MDEDYARRLQAWLRAEPGPAPRNSFDEREVAPTGETAADRTRAADDRDPQATADDAGAACIRFPALPIPAPRASGENGCRMSEAETRSRWNHPTNRLRREEATKARPRTEAEERSRREHPSNWRREEVRQPTKPEECHEEAEQRSPRNDPSNWWRRKAGPLTEAEEQSRWNHPSDRDRRSPRNHPANWWRRDQPEDS